MTYGDTVWNTSVLGFWHSSFYYILSQRCEIKKEKCSQHGYLFYLQKVNNAVTVFPCWGVVPHRNFSVEGSLSSLFLKLNIPGWTTFLKILFSLFSNWMAISSHSRLLSLSWKEKAIHPKNLHSFSPSMVSSAPQLSLSKKSVYSAVSSIALGWKALEKTWLYISQELRTALSIGGRSFPVQNSGICFLKEGYHSGQAVATSEESKCPVAAKSKWLGRAAIQIHTMLRKSYLWEVLSHLEIVELGLE